MADLVDVENSLVALISQTLYPNGTGQPSSTGTPAIVYAGWPTASRLDADLLALANDQPGGKIHLTVFPTRTERNTTRYMRRWEDVTLPVQTLTLTVSGQQVTVGGVVSTPQNVMLLVGHQPYVYAVKPTDTLTSIATALAALIPDAQAQNVGPVITLSQSANLTAARVGASGVAIQEIRRQVKVYQITVWADDPANREAAAKAIDPVLADTAFLIFPDTSAGRLIYMSSFDDDMVSKAILYRRDFLYSVEYGTYKTAPTTQITQTRVDLTVAVGGVPPFQPVTTVNS
jgi:hypothetical protein